MQHGVVAQGQGRWRRRRGEQGVDFGNAQDLGQTAADFRRVYFRQRIDDQQGAFLEEEKIGPEGGEPAGVGAGADASLAAELEKLLDLFLVNRRSFRLCAGDKAKKRVQISGVGGNGVCGEPSLDGQMLQEMLQMFEMFGELQGRGARGDKKKAPTVNRRGNQFKPDFSSG